MKIISFIVLTIFTLCAGFTQTARQLKIGDKAPEFTLRYATRDSVVSDPFKLSGMVGKRYIILAFYPADWSGGCTKEVCTLRDNFSDLAKLNAEIVAISGDYVFSHHEWAKYHNLPFKLLSDHNHEVAAMYNSYNDSNGYDKRSVYLLDKNGNIFYSDLNYSVSDLKSFANLKKALESLR